MEKLSLICILFILFPFHNGQVFKMEIPNVLTHETFVSTFGKTGKLNNVARFDGIGGLSGGGATSKLLVNYAEPFRSQILDYLFKPSFGASLHILKVEMGGDSQSTEGTEASHMHYSWEENYSRGYEWWLMVEAKKRNPNILLYTLPWAFPGWVGNGSGDPYKFPYLTASYVIKWILGAKRVYNLDIDFVGIWNERSYSVDYVKILRAGLDSNNLGNVKIVVGDGDWSPANYFNDTDFANAVYAIGAHYPGTTSSTQAQKSGKPLWASEDYSTFNNDVGGGCWARILNQNQVNGYMTSTISWNLIAAYYDDLPYPRCALMTANEPWSGHFELPAPFWVTAHTTQFTAPGWFYLPHGNGVGKLPDGGSYVSLMSPDSQPSLTIIIETMSHDHSQCIRPALPPYTVSPQNFTFILGPDFSHINKLQVWKTQLSFDGKTNSSYFVQMPSISTVNNQFTLNLGIDELYTVTSITSGLHGNFSSPIPASQPLQLPYMDNFEKYNIGTEPFLITPQIGSFEVVQSKYSSGKDVMQTVLEQPIDWCKGVQPTALVGNYNWSDVSVQLDVAVPTVNGTTGVYIAARVDQGGCGTFQAKGVFFWTYPSTKKFQVTADLAAQVNIYQGSFQDLKLDSYYQMSLIVKTDTTNKSTLIRLFIGSTQVAALSSVTTPLPARGFVGFGTKNFGLAYYDNLLVEIA